MRAAVATQCAWASLRVAGVRGWLNASVALLPGGELLLSALLPPGASMLLAGAPPLVPRPQLPSITDLLAREDGAEWEADDRAACAAVTHNMTARWAEWAGDGGRSQLPTAAGEAALERDVRDLVGRLRAMESAPTVYVALPPPVRAAKAASRVLLGSAV